MVIMETPASSESGTGGALHRRISVKIIAILAASLLLVELVILVFSAFSEYDRLVDHFRFESEVIVRAVDRDRLEDPDYVEALRSRLSELELIDIEAAAVSEEA
ncbi:MAG: hypothetical protein ACQETQ_10905, partial [Spirochaetota bacterium]